MVEEKTMLRTPGPTPVPPRVQAAMNQAMIGHRSGEFTDLFLKAAQKLKPIFGTKEEVYIVSASGTSVLEAAAVNILSPADEVVVVVTGAFGDRFASICERFGALTHRLDVAWGQACTKETLADFLQQYPHTKAVFATYCETSTAVLNPVQPLAEAVRENGDALFVVDGVSCLGGVPAQMDKWGIDILVTGSQKALMLPPGLAFISASARAWEAIAANKAPSFYLDLQAYRDSYQKGMTPYTPALSLIYGLDAAGSMIEEEGLHQVIQRHELMKNMLRAALKALDVPLLVEDAYASPTVTAIVSDAAFDADALRQVLKEDFNIAGAGGQKHLKGKLMRIGHMGWCYPSEIFTVVTYIELALQKMNKNRGSGAGVQSAEEVYLNHV